MSDGGATAPAFAVVLAAGPRPGLIRVIANGCTRAGASGVCTATATIDHEASARHEALWAWVPALRSPPAAALTVRGDVVAGTAALGVHNPDRASAGLALHAGGRIDAAALRVSAPSGSSTGASIASGDAELAALPGERFFARHFGMDKDAWSRQAAVTRIACTTGCAPAIATAIADGHRLLHVEGDLVLAGPLQLGSSAEPIVMVVSGAVRITGDTRHDAATYVYTSTAFPMLTGTLVTVAGFIPIGLNSSAAGRRACMIFSMTSSSSTPPDRDWQRGISGS